MTLYLKRTQEGWAAVVHLPWPCSISSRARGSPSPSIHPLPCPVFPTPQRCWRGSTSSARLHGSPLTAPSWLAWD